MKRLILFIVIIILTFSCGCVSRKESDIAEYNKLTNEKIKLARSYFDLMKNSKKNKNKIRQIDNKILILNSKIRKLSKNKHVQEYIDSEKKANKIQRKTGVIKSSPSVGKETGEFEYYIDDIREDEDWKYIDKDFVNPSMNSGLGDYAYELLDDRLIDDSELIDPEEGFSDKEMDTLSGGDAMELFDVEGEALGSDLEFEEEDFEEEDIED